jgi:hypothetical protein
VLGHYLIFNLHGTFFCYSPDGGSRRIWPVGRSATAFARATTLHSLVTDIFFGPSRIVAVHNSQFVVRLW